MTCTEARIAIGEDNNDLDDDTDNVATGDQPETSAVCDPVYDPNDATDVTSFAKKSYADVKSIVDPVGQAILGLSSAGTANSGDDARAMRWWNVLSAQERVYALYGDRVTVPSAPNDPGVGTQVVSVDRLGLAALPYSEIATGKMYTYDRDGDMANGNEISVALDDASKALVPEVKALINDRNILVYGTMGPYSGDYEGVVAWWSAIGCLEMQIAVGEDNEPGTEMMGFCKPVQRTGQNARPWWEPANNLRSRTRYDGWSCIAQPEVDTANRRLVGRAERGPKSLRRLRQPAGAKYGLGPRR